jgi:hypothetical protein
MGLIISYLLAQLEGGVLSIDSKAGEGTTVSVVLNCESHPTSVSEEETGNWSDVDVSDVSERIYKEKNEQPVLVIPPEDELKKLYDLAIQAYIQGILEQLDTIEQSDKQYAPFVAKLRQFTKAFRLDLVQQFIEKSL